jgi:dethiobiotin synthetase
LDGRREVVDLIEAFSLPVLLVGRSGLGTLNHTALSLEALAARKIPVLAVVLVQTTPRRDASMTDNAEWLSRLHRVPVLGPVPFCTSATDRRRAFAEILRPFAQRRDGI